MISFPGLRAESGKSNTDGDQGSGDQLSLRRVGGVKLSVHELSGDELSQSHFLHI